MGQYLDVARKVVAEAKSSSDDGQRYDINDLNDQSPVSTSRRRDWDLEARALIDWFKTTEPPTEPFELCRGVTVLAPKQWWESMMADIELGPDGSRARYGAVVGDLRKLHLLLG